MVVVSILEQIYIERKDNVINYKLKHNNANQIKY